jgi:CheY-like chemotaxis protein
VIQVSSVAKIEARANTSRSKADNRGNETTRRIRVGPESKAIPIIAVTSYALAGDEAKALAAGRNAYVTKPYLASDVRFGSLAVIAAALPNVRFTPGRQDIGR